MLWRVPLFEPDFGDLELAAVQEPIRALWTTMGETTARLESEFASRCGAKHAIAVSNCTAGLHLALSAAQLCPGDEVICPTLTFVATANAIRYVNAVPVFAESVGASNLNMGPSQVIECISRKSRAIVVMHYAGFPVDMIEILEIARRHNLVVIEDCAHALFSTLHGKFCGTWGLAAAFSFFGNKNMTCGEGGMVTTNDDIVAQRIRNMRSHGMTTGTIDRFMGRAFDYDVISHGYNYRLDEIRSALAIAQLQRLESFLQERNRVRKRYCTRLAGTLITVPDFEWPKLSVPGDRVGYHIMPILLPEGFDHQKVAAFLKERGIQSSLHYRPVHTFAAFAAAAPTAQRPLRTELLAERELTLPMYPKMTDGQVDLVCEVLLDAISTHDNLLASK